MNGMAANTKNNKEQIFTLINISTSTPFAVDNEHIRTGIVITKFWIGSNVDQITLTPQT